MKFLDYYFYQFIGLSVRLFVNVFFRFKVIKKHKIGRTRRTLVISNHTTLFDPLLIGGFLCEIRINYFAKEELFRVPFVRTIIRLLHAFPVKRGEADIEAIRKAIEVLNNNGNLLIFPEGTRSPDGNMKKFKNGAGYIVSRTKCNVLPVYLDGVFHVLPKHGKLRLRYPVKMIVGSIIPFEKINEDINDIRNYDEISNYLYENLKKLAGGCYDA